MGTIGMLQNSQFIKHEYRQKYAIYEHLKHHGTYMDSKYEQPKYTMNGENVNVFIKYWSKDVYTPISIFFLTSLHYHNPELT